MIESLKLYVSVQNNKWDDISETFKKSKTTITMLAHVVG